MVWRLTAFVLTLGSVGLMSACVPTARTAPPSAQADQRLSDAVMAHVIRVSHAHYGQE